MARAGRDPNSFEEWLSVADRKFKAARRVFDRGDPDTWTEAQGLLVAGVERVLKGVLCRHGRNGPELKSFLHNIVELCTEAAQHEPQLEAFKAGIADLAQIGQLEGEGQGPCTTSMEVGYHPFVVPVNTEEAGFFTLCEDLKAAVT